ncbi:hypothetical protein ACOSQ4_029583 [Xanthoceras sorbifolium]
MTNGYQESPLLKCFLQKLSQLTDSAAVAEAKAILMGAQFAVKKGLSPVCIASNTLKVVNINIIHDIKVICNGDNFDSISYTPRSSNMVAHCIAKWALVHCSSTLSGSRSLLDYSSHKRFGGSMQLLSFEKNIRANYM